MSVGASARFKCVALVLAAGRSYRFNGDKRLARLPSGNTILATTICGLQSIFDDVRVVLREEDDQVALGLQGVATIRSKCADQGLGFSLAAGIEALNDSDADAVAIFLGDMPYISASTIRQLVALANPQRIIFPCLGGKRGHPVVIARAFWPDMLNAKGDIGAKTLLDAHSDCCIRVAVDDAGVLFDIDRTEDLNRLPCNHRQ